MKSGWIYYSVRPPCPNEDNHSEGPQDFIEWHEWVKEIEKTHTQVQCPECKRWVIWIKD